MGPYNSLNKQLEYDKNTGEVLNWLHKIKKKWTKSLHTMTSVTIWVMTKESVTVKWFHS